MTIRDNMIVIAAVVLTLATFASGVDVYPEHSPSNRFEQDDTSDSDSVCGLCPDNSNFLHVLVLRGKQAFSSYMFVDLLLNCCNVVVKSASDVYPQDIRGKELSMQLNFIYIYIYTLSVCLYG